MLIILLIYLGYPSLAGFVLLGLMLPFQIWIGKVFSRLRLDTAVHTGKSIFPISIDEF